MHRAPRFSLARHARLACILVAALVAGAQPAWGQEPRDAGADAAAPKPSDDSGPRMEPRTPRPQGWEAWPHACSFKVPVCVHGARGSEQAIVRTLASAERAWDLATKVLDLPRPDPGATGAYRIYLVADERSPALGGGSTFLGDRDVLSRFDRSSAFTILDRALTGCALDATVAREIARASLYRAAPATDVGSARAETSYLARLMVPCAFGAFDGIDFFQRHPERAVVDPWRDQAPAIGDEYDRGAALFFWWADETFGAEPGSLVRGLWSLSPTVTPLGWQRWNDQPDGFAVLRTTFDAVYAASTMNGFEEMLVHYAVARAFVGADPDERAVLGAAAPVERWDVTWPAKARHLASTYGVAPTGSTYIWVSRAGAAKGSGLRVEASWENYTRMKWVVVKVDAHGKKIGENVIPSLERGTSANMSVRDLDEAAGVLLVGVSLGDFQFPFDPDDEVWEPHGWLVKMIAEP